MPWILGFSDLLDDCHGFYDMRLKLKASESDLTDMLESLTWCVPSRL
jgi:hypothetical protein